MKRLSSLFAPLGRGSLLLRFSLLSFVALALIAVVLSAVLERAMTQDALQQQADEVAVVVQEGVFGRHLTATARLRPAITPRSQAWWGSLTQDLLSADAHLVRVKVWDPTGRVIYSNNASQINRSFAIDDDLRTALSGRQAMNISALTAPENAGDRVGQKALLQTYIPIRAGGRVIGAYEAYSDLSNLTRRLDNARKMVWGSIAIGFIVLYTSLFAIVGGASRRLIRQMREITTLGERAREADALRRVDQLKDEFIGGVSHELRRPLASIKGYTASLLLPEADWSPLEQREFLHVIDEEADHLAATLNTLLDLARLGGGTLPLDREPLHVPVLASQIVRRLRSQAHLPVHPYALSFPTHFPYVEADNARLGQVLLNLLENAAKYAPAGTPIAIEGHEGDGVVTIDVTDQGPGLTPTQAERVFDKFYRVDSGLARATEGTGLGLALCRAVVEAHGGTITVVTAPEKGSTFTVTLPIVANVSAPDRLLTAAR